MTQPTGKNFCLLVLEDDEPLRETLVDYFTLRGYRVSSYGALQGVRDHFKAKKCDLVLLDLNLPDGDGLKLLKELRQWLPVPVIVVTGRHDQDSRMTALELQADDYVTKPLNLRELELRVRNCLVRYYQTPPKQDTRVCGWRYEPRESYLLPPAASPAPTLHLTQAENICLQALVRAAGNLVTNADLLTLLQTATGSIEVESLPVIISRLRQKLRQLVVENPVNPIENIPRQGYRLHPGVLDRHCL